MSYIPPALDALDLQFGSGYVAPVPDALDLQFGATSGGTTPIGVGAVTLDFIPDGVGATTPPTFTAIGAVALEFTPASAARHGIAGQGAAALDFSPSGSGLHPRYRLHGQILDGGVAVTAVRRVRAHKRSTGAVIGESDTVAGVFDIPVGYALDEFYLVPLDLDSSATDWAPPVANRVLSVLVTD